MRIHPAVLALLLAPAARGEAPVWDFAAAEQGRAVMPVFVAPPLADAALIAAVEGFLTELLIVRDIDAALKRTTVLIDDACLDYLATLKSGKLSGICRAGGRSARSPLEREAGWRTRMEWEISISPASSGGRASALGEIYQDLAPDSGFAAEVSRRIGGGRVEGFGPRFLVLRPYRAANLMPLGFAAMAHLPERYFSVARAHGAELRVVIGRRQPSGFQFDYFQTMLWAREGSEWRLWALGETVNTPPK